MGQRIKYQKIIYRKSTKNTLTDRLWEIYLRQRI